MKLSSLTLNAFFLFILISILSSANAEFTEGVHYERVNLSSPGLANKVTEFFSFSCPGCYFYEKYMSVLAQQLPESFEFQRIHTRFGGKNAQQSQLAFVLTSLLKDDKLKSEIFNRIHTNGIYFKDKEAVIAFFAENGYERGQLEKLLDSFAAKTMIKRMDKATMDARITSIPSLIVDGRFLIRLAEIKSAEQLADAVKHVSKL